MGMLALVAHYKNCFPNAQVNFTEDSLEVIQRGEVLVALRRGGGGALVDVGAQVGALYRHCMAPIPKNTRVWKLKGDDTLERDEKHAERIDVARGLAKLHNGKVPSIEFLKKEGYDFEGDSVAVKKD